jgi:hypothetical protein
LLFPCPIELDTTHILLKNPQTQNHGAYGSVWGENKIREWKKYGGKFRFVHRENEWEEKGWGRG